MFQYTIRMLVHPTYLVLSSSTLSNGIFCGSFLVKNHIFCVCNTSKINFIPQPQEQKSCRRQTQCSSTLCECQCTQPRTHLVLCPQQIFQMRYFVVHFCLIENLVIIFVPACHKSKMDFIAQPHKQKSGRGQTQCSSTLCECGDGDTPAGQSNSPATYFISIGTSKDFHLFHLFYLKINECFLHM